VILQVGSALQAHSMHLSLVSPAAPRAGPATVARKMTSLGRQRVIFSAAGGRSGGRTRWALLTGYTFGHDTIGYLGFIAAVTRTAEQRSFGGAGL
jgi:hypothetical protein